MIIKIIKTCFLWPLDHKDRQLWFALRDTCTGIIQTLTLVLQQVGPAPFPFIQSNSNTWLQCINNNKIKLYKYFGETAHLQNKQLAIFCFNKDEAWKEKVPKHKLVYIMRVCLIIRGVTFHESIIFLPLISWRIKVGISN